MDHKTNRKEIENFVRIIRIFPSNPFRLIDDCECKGNSSTQFIAGGTFVRIILCASRCLANMCGI